MNRKEEGLLMLCCPLGDERAHPLSAAQYRRLAQLISARAPEYGLRDLTESDLRRIGCAPADAERIVSLLDRQQLLEHYLTAAQRRGISVITRLSPGYPQALRKKLGADAPAALFYCGELSLFSLRAIALVGSRALREPGRVFAQRVGALSAKDGFVLVSGGAAGADSCAQNACLQAGGSVICYTAESLPERMRHRPDGMLLVSEGSWELPFSSQRALSRNRLIHAQAELSFVAQTDFEKGGTWRGTCSNLTHGWSPVFVCDDGSAGANGLAERGATPLKAEHLTAFGALSPNQQSMF